MSRWLYPFERRVAWGRVRRLAIATLLVFLVLLLLDRGLFHALYVGDARLEALEGRDWYRTLRVIGTLWLWAPLCGALLLAGAPRIRDGAARILVSAVLAGLAAEVLQVLAGRLRPNGNDGEHRFRGLIERFSNPDDLAFPSSHAAVAFGAACMAAFLWPRAGVVAVAMAVACGWTRLMSGAHFASDVFGAAVLGYAIARLLRPGGWWGDRRGLLLP
jgi:membrane-associated phospholipid phosphatase